MSGSSFSRAVGGQGSLAHAAMNALLLAWLLELANCVGVLRRNRGQGNEAKKTTSMGGLEEARSWLCRLREHLHLVATWPATSSTREIEDGVGEGRRGETRGGKARRGEACAYE